MKNHFGLNLKIFEIVQMLSKLQSLLTFNNHDFEQAKNCIRSHFRDHELGAINTAKIAIIMNHLPLNERRMQPWLLNFSSSHRRSLVISRSLALLELFVIVKLTDIAQIHHNFITTTLNAYPLHMMTVQQVMILLSKHVKLLVA